MKRIIECLMDVDRRLEEKFGSQLGLIYMFVQAFIFSVQSLSVKLLRNLPPFAITYLRGLGMTIFQISILDRLNVNSYLVHDKVAHKDMILRGFVGFFGLASLFCAVKLISLMEAITLGNLTPMFTCLFGWIFLKESFGWLEVFSSTICFAGVLMIVKPPFIMSLLASNIDKDLSFYDLNHFFGALLSLNYALCMTFIYIVLRKTRNNVHTMIPNQYFAIFCAFCAPFGMFYENYNLPTLTDLFVLLYLVLSSTLNVLIRTRALQLEKAGRVSIVNNSGVIFSYFFDVVVFHQKIHFLSFIGAGLVTLGSTMLFVKK